MNQSTVFAACIITLAFVQGVHSISLRNGIGSKSMDMAYGHAWPQGASQSDNSYRYEAPAQRKLEAEESSMESDPGSSFTCDWFGKPCNGWQKVVLFGGPFLLVVLIIYAICRCCCCRRRTKFVAGAQPQVVTAVPAVPVPTVRQV